MLENIKKEILLVFLLLILVIVFFEFTNFDILIQSFFYNFELKSWFWDKNEPILKFILYDGIKRILILFAVSILILLLFFRKKKIIKEYKRGLTIILLSAIFVPFIVISLKSITNIPCPCNIQYFNGKYPSIKLLDKYPKDFIQKSKIKCWPAGHASAGFSLLSLFFLFKTQVNKKRGLFSALAVGWSMGTYKMLIGDHFLSHTIITMMIAWLIILVISLLIKEELKE